MTTMIKADEQVLKTDELRRVRTPAARRESLIQECERSGLSGAKFAALTGIKYSTFASWLQKRRRGACDSRVAEMTPVPVDQDSVRRFDGNPASLRPGAVDQWIGPLNVAGPRGSKETEIGAFVRSFMRFWIQHGHRDESAPRARQSS